MNAIVTGETNINNLHLPEINHDPSENPCIPMRPFIHAQGHGLICMPKTLISTDPMPAGIAAELQDDLKNFIICCRPFSTFSNYVP